MTFEEWFHKEYEPADLQIKQCAERNEGLHIPAKVYLEELKEAYEAGLYADVHTDNSKVIAELEKKIKKIRDYLAYKIPRELMNDATNKIWNMV